MDMQYLEKVGTKKNRIFFCRVPPLAVVSDLSGYRRWRNGKKIYKKSFFLNYGSVVSNRFRAIARNKTKYR